MRRTSNDMQLAKPIHWLMMHSCAPCKLRNFHSYSWQTQICAVNFQWTGQWWIIFIQLLDHNVHTTDSERSCDVNNFLLMFTFASLSRRCDWSSWLIFNRYLINTCWSRPIFLTLRTDEVHLNAARPSAHVTLNTSLWDERFEEEFRKQQRVMKLFSNFIKDGINFLCSKWKAVLCSQTTRTTNLVHTLQTF